jgi:hypothetical protein
MVYELRRYVAAPGKAGALLHRFEHGTLAIFARAGIRVEHFWRDRSDPAMLLYVCSFADDAAREVAWKAFGADPAWHALKAETERDGPLTTSMTSELFEPILGFPAA